ncbi:penicillin-binding protein activator LpoB [Propionivibrio limicola]|uniref:penicillin-binding protein activator LpoB n=1 Tax=Propionivibrio limicola TaxID=167645 RepID=UPI001291B152|nr:penicillin-binding protein activator LpoB [Propionivibrio limicola]
MSPFLKKVLLSCCLLGSALTAQAAGSLRVAVTDLAYEERVQEYFRNISATEKSSVRASARESERESDYSYSRRASGSLSAKSESTFSYSEGTYSYIDRGELRKFTADIKGEILKSGYFQVTQAKPFTAKNSEKLYDVIARIKQGMYPGADYVLFGSISSIEFRQEANPIDHTDTVSHTLSLELVGEFSLISTRNYQVKASFSAMGEGQDVKLVSSRGARIVLNRGKVISEVSKSLGVEVLKQMEDQLAALDGDAPVREAAVHHAPSPHEEVIIFR